MSDSSYRKPRPPPTGGAIEVGEIGQEGTPLEQLQLMPRRRRRKEGDEARGAGLPRCEAAVIPVAELPFVS